VAVPAGADQTRQIEEIENQLAALPSDVAADETQQVERARLEAELAPLKGDRRLIQQTGADAASVAAFRQNVREGSKETLAHFIGQDIRERERKRTAALSRRRGAATRTTTLLGSARA
jgi:hypothetical protein